MAVSRLNTTNEITILLLGETGVGKSTFINAFVNYLANENLTQASRNVACLIPSQFTLYDQKTYSKRTVTLGKFDANENAKKTESSTQSPRCYVFPIGGVVLKIIDTPGIGDTRGVDRDGSNMRKLLKFIAQYKELNAICILLQPNNSRVGVVFKYCILQLLSHLNKSASQNIIFLFTNARSTFYAPGDTAPALIDILNAVKERPPYVDIKFDRDNIYCLDNEAFRFLVATSDPNNMECSPEMRRDYEMSYGRAVKECVRLMEYITSLKPHIVQDTISINNARQNILLLTKPLGDIAKNIADNVKAQEIHKRKIHECKGDIEELQRNLFTPVVDIVSEYCDPKTVCGHENCCRKEIVNGSEKIHYAQICHNPCYLDNDDGNIIGNRGLLDCRAFNRYVELGAYRWYPPGTDFHPDCNIETNDKGEMWGTPSDRKKSDFCFECKHSFETHLHINYETRIVNTERRDEMKYSRITTAQEAARARAQIIDELESNIKQIENESKIITECTSKFASFLGNNALTPFNDAFEDYVKHLISNEKSGVLVSGDYNYNMDALQKILDSHIQEKKILQDALKKGGKSKLHISSEDIEYCINQLCALPINGPKIKEYLIKQKQNQSNAHSISKEVNCDIKSQNKSLYGTFRKWFG